MYATLSQPVNESSKKKNNLTNLAVHELTESPGALTVPRVGEARLGHDSILLY